MPGKLSKLDRHNQDIAPQSKKVRLGNTGVGDRDSSGRAGQTNLASTVADVIEQRIESEKLPDGTFIGTERDVCAQYNMGGALFRQVGRILEQRGVAYIRRGPSGGLVVQEDRINAVGHMLATFLCFTRSHLVDFRDSAAIISDQSFKQAVPRLKVETAAKLRAKLKILDDSEQSTWQAIHRNLEIRNAVYDAAENPALSLFHRALANAVIVSMPLENVQEGQRNIDRQIGRKISENLIEALITNNFQKFCEVNSENVRFITDRKGSWKFDSFPVRSSLSSEKVELDLTSGGKLPERVARAILLDIGQRGWPVGERLGTEPELLERFGVSRATFREAACLLEQYSAVERRRGPSGGLVVCSPDPKSLVKLAVAALKGANIQLDHVRSLQIEFQACAVDSLARINNLQAFERLQSMIVDMKTARGEDLRDRLANFQTYLMDMTQNQSLIIFSKILSALASSRDIDRSVSDADIVQLASDTLGNMLVYAASKDQALAKLSMREFMVGETSWLTPTGLKNPSNSEK